VLIFAAVLVALEVALVLTVRALRSGFQWLITEADELPSFDREALHKFITTSFDPVLGWVRRPGTTGREKGKKGDLTFHIDAAGARASASSASSASVAAFGDSYVFCRQVADDETWEEALARAAGIGVMNFGVGNYGADQGLLRYETTELPSTVEVAILGFVPETICRVQSYWKHYLEFGNTFAFKPRFRMVKTGGLELCETVMKSESDFSMLGEKLPRIQALDGFYQRKFRAVQFRLPYLWSFLKHPARHGRLIGALLLRGVARTAGIRSRRLENRPFALIMRQNIADAHRLYNDTEATELLRAVLRRFNERALARGHKPLVLVIPQLIDLQSDGDGSKPYEPFFQELACAIPVLDVTRALREHDLSELYVEDQYGGHLSARGNEIVAERVAVWLAQNAEIAQPKAHVT
jgi:hypothetical protein